MRNVVVTGGSRGLGLAIARSLAEQSYRVIVIARSMSEKLRDAMVQAQTDNCGAICFQAFDLTEIAGLGSLVRSLVKEFGPIYGIINNAGLGTAGILTMMREEQIEALVRLNTVSPITLVKYALRSMMVERSGRIIMISSIVASTGYSGLSAYSATKASLLGFTRSLAREVGPLGITVNAVSPGFISTEMTRDLDTGQREQIARRSALRRLPDAHDVAAAVVFLLSDGARNVTGVTLTVDAGNTA